jgi:peptide/nickel transport system permease protein
MAKELAVAPIKAHLRTKPPSTAGRILKFTLKRALSLLAIVFVSVFITVLITSKSVVIDRDISLEPEGANPSPIFGWFSGISNPRIMHRPDAHVDDPSAWLQTAVRLTTNGLILNLGQTQVFYWNAGYMRGEVREVILDALPRTLLLFGSANLLIFFSSLVLALVTSRNPGNWFDRMVVSLSPLSSVPPWIYALGIGVFTFRVLRTYTGGLLNTWPDEFSWDFALVLLRFMGPAILAVFLSKFFMSVYIWRSFLLIFSNEDYIELAKAKGLPPRLLERRYLLRPVLPNLITSFTMMMIAIWQEAIIIELFFNVTGIGHVFYNAIRYKDMPLIVGLTVIFAYLLALSVFVLDLIYGIVDPRVNVGEEGKEGRAVSWRLNPLRRLQKARRRARLLASRNGPKPGSAWQRRARQPLGELIPAAFANFKDTLAPARQVLRTPTAVIGLVVIALLVGVSVYTVFARPYTETIRIWNASQHLWLDNPDRAMPVWVNLFRRDKLPENIILRAGDPRVTVTRTALNEEITDVVYSFKFDYPYHGFPQNMLLNLRPKYESKLPHISLEWHTPDGRQIEAGEFAARISERYSIAGNTRLVRRLGGVDPNVGLFADPGTERLRALPGTYELRASALLFEVDSDFEADFQLFGQVWGLAGTDHYRRDLTLALMWGAPVALAFGILGAAGASLATMTIAALGAWFGGWIDGLIQRLTEVNMILPAFPILLIVYNFYSKSVWVILGVAVLLGIFGSAIKTQRSLFLQIKQAPYIEAARSYGSSDLRIIFGYLTPRILPALVPQFVVLIPTFVYLEATLAYLNMSDPFMPTWGKAIREAAIHGGLDSAYHTLLLPVGILLITGFSFLMVGYALEKALNPHLRDV